VTLAKQFSFVFGIKIDADIEPAAALA
jgi:hypothetical protein